MTITITTNDPIVVNTIPVTITTT